METAAVVITNNSDVNIQYVKCPKRLGCRQHPSNQNYSIIWNVSDVKKVHTFLKKSLVNMAKKSTQKCKKMVSHLHCRPSLSHDTVPLNPISRGYTIYRSSPCLWIYPHGEVDGEGVRIREEFLYKIVA